MVKQCQQRLLARPAQFVNVTAVPFARVPIVTGTVLVPTEGDSGAPVHIDFDISVNNTLALHNTDLLRTYAQLDSRCAQFLLWGCGHCDEGLLVRISGSVRPLVFVLKHWAKARKLNSAPAGTLSSYGTPRQ